MKNYNFYIKLINGYIEQFSKEKPIINFVTSGNVKEVEAKLRKKINLKKENGWQLIIAPFNEPERYLNGYGGFGNKILIIYDL